MQHIGAMSAMFDGVVSRDGVLKEAVLTVIQQQTGLRLTNNQVVIGQTVCVIRNITFAERTVLQNQLDEQGVVDYCNNNPHGFVLQGVLIR